MMTITEIAALFKVSEQAAYGFMQFLKEVNLVTITEAAPNGKRGRRPKLYQLGEDGLEAAAHLNQLRAAL